MSSAGSENRCCGQAKDEAAARSANSGGKRFGPGSAQQIAEFSRPPLEGDAPGAIQNALALAKDEKGRERSVPSLGRSPGRTFTGRTDRRGSGRRSA